MRPLRWYPARRAHSPAASAIGRQISNCQPIPGNKNRQESNSKPSTEAVITRCLSADLMATPEATAGLVRISTGLAQRIDRLRFNSELLAGAPKTALPISVRIDRTLK